MTAARYSPEHPAAVFARREQLRRERTDREAGRCHAKLVVHGSRRLHREGLGVVFDAEPDLSVVGVAETATEVLAACLAHLADAVVLDADIALQELVGLAIALQRQAVQPWIVGVYDGLDVSRAEHLYSSGIDILVSKAAGISRLLHAVRLAPSLGRGSGDGRPNADGALTTRELDVLRLLAAGATSQEISEHLLITPKTVENHKQHLFRKLGVRSQAHAVAVAMESGMFTDERSVG